MLMSQLWEESRQRGLELANTSGAVIALCLMQTVGAWLVGGATHRLVTASYFRGLYPSS